MEWQRVEPRAEYIAHAWESDSSYAFIEAGAVGDVYAAVYRNGDRNVFGEYDSLEEAAKALAEEYGILEPGQVWEHNVSGREFTIDSLDADGLDEESVGVTVEPYDEYPYITVATRIFPQQLTLQEWEL